MNVDQENRQLNERGPTTLRPRGDLDLAAAPRFRQELQSLMPASELIIDLRAVDFVDSAGIGVLIGALRRQRQAGGSLRLVNLSPPITELFELVGLDRLFDAERAAS